MVIGKMKKLVMMQMLMSVVVVLASLREPNRWSGPSLVDGEDDQMERVVDSRWVDVEGRYEPRRKPYAVTCFGIVSAMYHFEQRRAVRQAWAGQLQSVRQMDFVFVVGLVDWKSVRHSMDQGLGLDLDKRNYVKVLEEASVYHDILFVPIIDRYENLVLKTLHFMDYCGNLPFARSCVKMDDDVYINVLAMMNKVIRPLEKKRLLYYHGHVWSGKPVRDRAHKNFISEETFSEDTLPPYSQGALVVFSAALARSISSEEPTIKSRLFRNQGGVEDVQVALLIHDLLKIRPSHEPRFATLETCHDDAVSLCDVNDPKLMIHLGQSHPRLCTDLVKHAAINVLLKRYHQYREEENATSTTASILNNLAIHYILLHDLEHHQSHRSKAINYLQMAISQNKLNAQEKQAISSNINLINWYDPCGPSHVKCIRNLQAIFARSMRQYSQQIAQQLPHGAKP